MAQSEQPQMVEPMVYEEPDIESSLSDRADAWEDDRVDLDQLFYNIGKVVHSVEVDETVKTDAHNALIELLSRENLPSLHRAQASLWMATLVDEDPVDYLQDARYWISDLEIVAESTGVESPKIALLQSQARELALQLEGDDSTKPEMERDPAVQKLRAFIAEQRAATSALSKPPSSQPATATAGPSTSVPGYTTLPSGYVRPTFMTGNQLLKDPEARGPEMSFEEKMKIRRDVARYERDVIAMEEEEKIEAETKGAQAEAEGAKAKAGVGDLLGVPKTRRAENPNVPVPGQPEKGKNKKTWMDKLSFRAGNNKASAAVPEVSSVSATQRRKSSRFSMLNFGTLRDQDGSEAGSQAEGASPKKRQRKTSRLSIFNLFPKDPKDPKDEQGGGAGPGAGRYVSGGAAFRGIF
ncbi:hypothetical protein LTR17_017684 [Elasticomyces elasticus]|nr:hypothetical protein LTR17_017684 [Elasticomyces elasticus]